MVYFTFIMNERVLTLFSTHQNPLPKFSVVQKKYFLPNEECANEEAEVVKDRLTNLFIALIGERVDKRNARSKGELIHGTDIIKILKSVGLNLNNMGFNYDKTKCLNPQEALYLLETNRMEICHNTVPLSLQSCYKEFLASSRSLNKYRVYRKLSIDGFKLALFKNWCVKDNCENRTFKKIKYDDAPESSENDIENSNMVNIFNRLRQNAPKESTETYTLDCDYKMYYPTNSKKDGPDMDIYVQSVHKLVDKLTKPDLSWSHEVGWLIHFMNGADSTSTDFDPKYGFLNNKMLFGLVTPNNIAFYRIGRVKIPTL